MGRLAYSRPTRIYNVKGTFEEETKFNSLHSLFDTSHLFEAMGQTSSKTCTTPNLNLNLDLNLNLNLTTAAAAAAATTTTTTTMV